ncbi:NACHT domain-containing protein [Glycomyces sp. MUSA5-2]|uniref:NACHT domain-containing protein n=1 Tax=Glycomyces sp. MUSA5-2 TaxID=2053002 RepID=UPI00300ADECF
MFAAATAFLFSADGRPLWIGVAGGILVAAAVVWGLWRRARSYLCVLRYRSRIRGNRYMNSVTLLGAVSRALPGLTLDDVYVDVALRNDETDRGGQKVFGWSPGRPGERATLDRFLSRGGAPQFAVYGMPGSGKSTLLRSTAMRMARSIRPSAPMPILVVLAHHTGQIVGDPGIDLAEIAAGARWLNRDDIPVQEVRRWLSGGRCVIMLDGLDEVPEQHRPAVMLWAEQQHGAYEGCTLVVTSREIGFESARFDAADLVLEVCPLTRDQIDLFVANCYRAFRKGGEVVGRRAAAEEAALLAGLQADPALYDLASTPLLLQLMVFVHRSSDDGLPASRGELYERMVQMLLHERRNRVKLSMPANRLELRPKRRIVQRLAFEMMRRELVQFDPLPLVKELIEEFEVEVPAQEVLRDLRENGLLSRVDSNSDVYMFAHLSFQEYLAAEEIHEQGRIDALLDRIGRRWWRGTALFWASAYDANPLIEACIAAGTADAWSLAIELQNESGLAGREIAPHLAERVAAFLTGAHDVDSEEHRVVCAELISRNLSEVAFSESGAVCTKPVGGDLYRAFAREQRAQGLWPSSHRFGPDGQVLGLWPGEVFSFAQWLTRFDHHGFDYRLPRARAYEHPQQILAVRDQVAGPPKAVWVRSNSRVELRDFSRLWISKFEVSLEELESQVRADWRFMMSRFDFAHCSDEAPTAAGRIASACAGLKEIVAAYKTRIGSPALSRDPQSASAKAIDAHLAFVNTLSNAVDELNLFADSDSVNLLAILRIVAANSKPPTRSPSGVPAFPAAAVKQHLDLVQDAVRTAVQVSYRLHRGCYREGAGTPAFLGTAGALLLACRLPADGTPTSYKLPRRLAESMHKGLTVFPEQLPGYLEEVIQMYGANAQRHRLRPRKLIADMLTDLRQPIADLAARRTAIDLEMLASMRIALCAAAIWTEAQEFDPLWSCVSGLTAIEARYRDPSVLNEAIVLIRKERD